MSANFKAPKKPDGPVFDDVLKRKIRYWDGKMLNYQPDMFERYRIVHIYNKQTFPDLTHIQLVSMTRYIIPEANMVEIDEQGTLDADHKVKECLVWSQQEYVDQELYIQNGGDTGVQTLGHGGAYTYGTFQGVEPKYTYNRNKEIVDAKPAGLRNIFYVPWSRKTAEQLIKKIGEPIRPCTVRVANAKGHALYSQTIGNKSVPCFQEFLEAESGQDLIDANNCLMLRKDYGGFKEYLEKKDNARKLGISVHELIAEARRKQLAELEAVMKGKV